MEINKTYLKKEILNEIKEFFEKEAFIQLNSFFPKKTKEIKKAFQNSRYWDKNYNPLIKSESKLDLTEEFNLEVIQTIEFFKSKEFLHYIEEITQVPLTFNSLEVQKYSHKDFTLLNDLNKNDDVIEVYFDLSDKWNESYGGSLVFLTKEEEILYLEPEFNTLTILYKPEEIMKYLKYINNRAGNKSIYRIAIKFDITEEN